MNLASQGKDGTIVDQVRCSVTEASYDDYVLACEHKHEKEAAAARREGFQLDTPRDFTSRLPGRDEYERRNAYEGFECLRITYLSDGLRVVGYIWKPTSTEGRKLPLIIYNRGGNRELGKLTPSYRFGFHHFLSSGFVVIGSQYRGNDGGEGREELGGADVRDVLNLMPLAQGLGYVDTGNVFMLGESRGGMMTFLALRNGMPCRAVAVLGAMVDLVADAASRPELLDVAHRQLIPDFDQQPEEHMRERSAVHWPEKIDVPVLMMHGGADWRSDPGKQTLALAQKLQQLRKTYELIIYAQDDHVLSLNREDSDRRIVEWFRRYIK